MSVINQDVDFALITREETDVETFVLVNTFTNNWELYSSLGYKMTGNPFPGTEAGAVEWASAFLSSWQGTRLLNEKEYEEIYGKKFVWRNN